MKPQNGIYNLEKQDHSTDFSLNGVREVDSSGEIKSYQSPPEETQ